MTAVVVDIIAVEAASVLIDKPDVDLSGCSPLFMLMAEDDLLNGEAPGSGEGGIEGIGGNWPEYIVLLLDIFAKSAVLLFATLKYRSVMLKGQRRWLQYWQVEKVELGWTSH